MLLISPLDGAVLLLVRASGRDNSWEEEPEPEVELSCGRAETTEAHCQVHSSFSKPV